jgi:hypothetical protein
MKKALAVMMTVLAVGCMSSRSMMTSDRATMSNDGSMMIMNSDGTSRAMTDSEMQAHMSMMMNDPRYSSMMADRCRSMATMNPSSSGMSSTSGTSSGMSGSSTTSTGMSDTSMTSGGMSGMSSMPASGASMMVMNTDGTSRAMTDAEYRMHMDMMMKNSTMSQAMMSKCNSGM